MGVREGCDRTGWDLGTVGALVGVAEWNWGGCRDRREDPEPSVSAPLCTGSSNLSSNLNEGNC